MGGIGGRELPELRKLDLAGVVLDSGSSTALASAIASGVLCKLQEFHFGGNDDGDDDTSLVEVLAAMASSCPDLRYLELFGGFSNPATRLVHQPRSYRENVKKSRLVNSCWWTCEITY